MPKVKDRPGVTKTKTGKLLTDKQRKFVEAYVANGFNGVQAAAAAYEIDNNKSGWYSTATSISSENLTKPDIIEAIKQQTGLLSLERQHLDQELAFVITQRNELAAKNKALEMAYKLDGAFEKDNKQKAQVINFLEEREYEPRDND